MYSVWFQDLEKAIKVLQEKCPHVTTFISIAGNAYGDFVIKSAVGDSYIIKHSDFSVWHRGNDWKDKWTEVE